MADPNSSNETRLNPAAERALADLLAGLRESLLGSAASLTADGRVTEEELYQAYKHLSFPNKAQIDVADAQMVISRAFRENRIIEWISYAMALVLFVYGLVLLSLGMGANLMAPQVGRLISGTIVELLILIPFRFAVNARRHNIALRMLGLVLNRVHDPKTLAPLLKETFAAVVMGPAADSGGASKRKRR